MLDKPAQFTALVARHVLSQIMGDDGFEMLIGELSAIVGDEFKARIQSLLTAPITDEQLLQASQWAEKCFSIETSDPSLQQLLQSLPLAGLESLQIALRNLPLAYDESVLAKTLFELLKSTWPLGDAQKLNEALRLYLSCLRRSLSRLPGIGPLILNWTILRTGDTVEKLQLAQNELAVQQKQWTSIIQALSNKIGNSSLVLTNLYTIDAPPETPSPMAPRTPLVEQVRAYLGKKPWVYLRAAIGLGKTQLARLIFMQYGEGRRIWIRVPEDASNDGVSHIRMQLLLVRVQHIVNSCKSEKAQDIVNTFWALVAGVSWRHAVSSQEAVWTTTMTCAGARKRSVYG